VQVSNITLSLWQLGDVIETQQAAGSNVESLRTLWHMKISAAAALMVLALMAVAVITWRENIYMCVAIGLICTFLLFLLNALSPTLGSYGVMSPFWAAWFPNTLFFIAAMARLIWFHWPHKLHAIAEEPAVGQKAASNV
jgi:lipopolysaccharide export system permease protein